MKVGPMAPKAQQPSTGSGASPVAGLPLRVACVDMGSNAIRIVAAELRNEKDHEVVLHLRGGGELLLEGGP